MQLNLFIIIAIFGGLGLVAIGAVIGYLFGKEKNRSYLNSSDLEWMYQERKKQGLTQSDEEGWITKSFTPDKEIKVSDEPSGIIYRPTPAELDKMNEDKATKEAKEAMAETLRNEEPPII